MEGGGPGVPNAACPLKGWGQVRVAVSALGPCIRVSALSQDQPGNHTAIEAGQLGIVVEDLLLHYPEVLVHRLEEEFVGVHRPVAEHVLEVCQRDALGSYGQLDQSLLDVQNSETLATLATSGAPQESEDTYTYPKQREPLCPHANPELSSYADCFVPSDLQEIEVVTQVYIHTDVQARPRLQLKPKEFSPWTL